MFRNLTGNPTIIVLVLSQSKDLTGNTVGSEDVVVWTVLTVQIVWITELFESDYRVHC